MKMRQRIIVASHSVLSSYLKITNEIRCKLDISESHVSFSFHNYHEAMSGNPVSYSRQMRHETLALLVRNKVINDPYPRSRDEIYRERNFRILSRDCDSCRDCGLQRGSIFGRFSIRTIVNEDTPNLTT